MPRFNAFFELTDQLGCETWPLFYQIPRLVPIIDVISGTIPTTTAQLTDTDLEMTEDDTVELGKAQHKSGIPIKLPDWKFNIPLDIGADCTILKHESLIKQTATVFNRYAIVDFRIENGMSMLSAATSEKIWFFAPLTNRNLELYEAQAGSSRSSLEVFVDTLARFEYLIMVQQMPRHAMWVPTGMIYCTYSPVAGCVYGVKMHIIEHIPEHGRTIVASWNHFSHEQKSAAVRDYEDVVLAALGDDTFVMKAVAGLCYSRLRILVRQDREPWENFMTLMRWFWTSEESEKKWRDGALCPCGWFWQSGRETVIEHIASEHIRTLGLGVDDDDDNELMRLLRS